MKRIPSALKHGAFSATAVLPGESRAAFEKLHQELIAEHTPSGALENNIVATIARLVWRKENLGTLRIAENVQSRWSKIGQPTFRTTVMPPTIEIEHQSDKEIATAIDQTKKDFGPYFSLIEVGEAATFDGLAKELDVRERLDSLIDRCLKRLLFLRGLKTISNTSPPNVIGPPSGT